MMMRKLIKISLALLPLLLLLALAPVVSAKTTAKANHEEIDIGISYNGSTVSVSGVTEKDVDLLIKVYSRDSSEQMKVKTQVGGFLWMNGQSVEFKDVPNVYLLRGTATVDELLDRSEQEAYDIGYAALAANGSLEPEVDPDQKTQLFEEFFRYKEEGSLYARSTGGIDLETDGQQQKYDTVFDWPYQAPPDDYMITVYAVRDGRVIETADAKLVVEEVGVERALTDLAMERGGLYGIAAILVAVSAGFGVGVIFKTGGGAH